MKKIGIITINYNNKFGLQKTFDSVFSQQDLDFDYYIIDGGSNDGSKELIESYSDRITYWVSEKDNGVYNAMNKGILKATSEYLLFLNSGDYLFDNNVLYAASNKLKKDLVYYNVKVVESMEHFFVKSFPEKFKFSDFIKESLPHHQATFISRQLFSKVGLYNESLQICSDWEFFVKAICLYQCSYLKVDEILSVYSTDGISGNPKNYSTMDAERLLVLKNSFASFLNDYDELQKLSQKMKHVNESRVLKLLKKVGLVNWL